MGKIMKADLKGPATLQAVLEAVVLLGAHDETEILELAAAGRLQELFPFRPGRDFALPPDHVAAADLIEASPLPLDPQQRASLMQSSLPPRKPRPRAGTKAKAANRSKAAR